jgi:hypothetical protein
MTRSLCKLEMRLDIPDISSAQELVFVVFFENL